MLKKKERKKGRNGKRLQERREENEEMRVVRKRHDSTQGGEVCEGGKEGEA